MKLDVTQLEPAERNPAQLRKTALILVAVMIVGGFFITIAYRRHLENQDYRPSILSRFIEFEALKVQEANTGEHAITELWGKVWIAAAVSRAEPEKSQLNIDKLHSVLQSLPANERPPVLLFFIDVPPADSASLKDLYPEFGGPDTCWRIGADDEETRDTLKKRLKIEVHLPKEPTQTIYTQAGIVVVDKNRHLRGWSLDNDFDFQTAAQYEADYEAAKKEHPNATLNPVPVTIAQMEKLFRETLSALRTEKVQ